MLPFIQHSKPETHLRPESATHPIRKLIAEEKCQSFLGRTSPFIRDSVGFIKKGQNDTRFDLVFKKFFLPLKAY